MKNTLLIITIISILSSCGSKKNNDQANASQEAGADTSGLAEFQNWKQQKEQLQDINLQTLPDVSQSNVEPVNETPVVQQAPRTATKIVYRDRPVRRKSAPVRTYSPPEERYEEPVVYGTPAGKSREAVSRNGAGTATGGSGDGTGVSEGAGTSNGPVATADPIPEKKKGWSKAAKGTVIGAASGAVLGAIVTKGSAKGAIIGGVAGGLGGYVLGRAKDKKDGRYLVAN